MFFPGGEQVVVYPPPGAAGFKRIGAKKTGGKQ
jgi:hypothetical protein